jgi:hypothetical protein
VANLSGYDKERGKRYKRWWSRQKGAPQGELISVPTDAWQRRNPEPAREQPPAERVGKG